MDKLDRLTIKVKFKIDRLQELSPQEIEMCERNHYLDRFIQDEFCQNCGCKTGHALGCENDPRRWQYEGY